jgi:molecular chaperone HscA
MLLQIHEPGKTPDIPQKKGVVVGIDFGTTNCVVAVSRHGKTEVVPIEGKRLVPSLVSYKGEGIRVGDRAMSDPEAVRSIKRFIEAGGPINPEKNPIDISADILSYLKRETEKVLEESIRGVVLTVPAYYGERAREALRSAALKADLPVLRLLNEPTAAALAYHLDSQEEGVYLVYDLGGGTFDVSILHLQKGIFQVLAVSGDPRLGGDDMDEVLLSFLETSVGSLSKKEGVMIARTIKEALTLEPYWEGTVRGEKVKVSRETLNQLIQPFIKRTLKLCEQALQDAAVVKSAIKATILVGGATRMPFLQQELKDFFGKEPLSSLNPDEAVALGAALHADSLMTGKGNLLIDVTPFSLGIETLDGGVETLISRNSPLPCSVSQYFTTGTEGQTKIKIQVVQGEAREKQTLQSLGTFVLSGIPPLPAGKPHLKITFTLDADGILLVSAEEFVSGEKQAVHLKPSFQRI